MENLKKWCAGVWVKVTAAFAALVLLLQPIFDAVEPLTGFLMKEPALFLGVLKFVPNTFIQVTAGVAILVVTYGVPWYLKRKRDKNDRKDGK